jgi:hypothetical protein
MALRRSERPGTTSCNIAGMTDHDEHLKQFALLNTSADPDIVKPEVREEWAVFNDPAFLGPRFERGEIHPALREKLLEEPMHVLDVEGTGKRVMLWINETRAQHGKLATEGPAILRHRTVTTSSWRTIEGEELEGIDAGRRPHG